MTMIKKMKRWVATWNHARIITLRDSKSYFTHEQFMKMYADIPEAVYRNWVEQGPEEFKGMKTSFKQWIRSVEGLLMYFKVVQKAQGKPTLLVSVAADAVWHAWLREDPKGLKYFQLRHFGKALEHVERHAMVDRGINTTEALTNTWAVCRKIEGAPLFYAVHRTFVYPPLFLLDKELNFPGGNWYNYYNGKIELKKIEPGAWGADSWSTPVALTAGAFVATGWITSEEALAYQAPQKKETSDSGGGGCGAYVGSCSSNGDSGDGGGDGGDGGGDGGGGCGGCG